MPGERSLVLASPGFFAQTPEGATALAEILDLAAKSNVVVSTLSVHGVIVAEGEDITARAEPNHLMDTTRGRPTLRTTTRPRILTMPYSLADRLRIFQSSFKPATPS